MYQSMFKRALSAILGAPRRLLEVVKAVLIAVALAILLAILSGCAGKGMLVREAPPLELLQECPAPIVPYATNGDLARAIPLWRNALDLCNNDKQALREWAK